MHNFNHLFYFYSIVKHGGVTAAAKKLNVAQPALSSQLKVLETQLKLKLLRRVGRKLKLTTDGERIYDFCIRMFEIAEQMDGYLHNTLPLTKKQFRIGVSNEIERPFVVDTFSSVIKSQKAARGTLISHHDEKLISLMQEGSLDLIILNRQILDSSLNCIGKFMLPVKAYASSRYIKSLSLKKLSLKSVLLNKKVGFVMPSSSLRLRFESDLFIQKHQYANDIIFECDMISGVARAISEGLGIGFLPEIYVKKEVQRGGILAISGSEKLWNHSFFIFSNKYQAPDATTTSIIKEFQLLLNT